MALSDWRPTVEQVAVYLRARTYIDGTVSTDAGSEAGTFTTETRPTAAQVEAAIDEAAQGVLSAFVGGEVPAEAYEPARRAAALRAALTVELSYFPEQAEESSPYLQLKAAADTALATLLAAQNQRALYGA